MDLFEKAYKKQPYEIVQEMGIYPYFHELKSGQDTVVNMEGNETIMIGSNNYLGLTSEPSVIEAGVNALKQYGTGCSGSRFLNGTLDIHVKLEKELAELRRKQKRAQDKRAEMDEIRAKRAYEESERKARLKEEADKLDRYFDEAYHEPKDDENAYIARINGRNFLKKASRVEGESTKNDILFHDSGNGSYYIVEVQEAVSSTKLSKSSIFLINSILVSLISWM